MQREPGLQRDIRGGALPKNEILRVLVAATIEVQRLVPHPAGALTVSRGGILRPGQAELPRVPEWPERLVPVRIPRLGLGDAGDVDKYPHRYSGN